MEFWKSFPAELSEKTARLDKLAMYYETAVRADSGRPCGKSAATTSLLPLPT